MRIKVIVTAAIVLLLIPIFAAAGNLTLIGNSSVTASELTKKDVGKIFLGKKIVWDDKTKIVIALQKNPAAHDLFLEKYMRKSPTLFANYWNRQIFTGKVKAPNTFENDQEVLKFVSETKGAIGYVSSGTNLKNVKIISVK